MPDETAKHDYKAGDKIRLRACCGPGGAWEGQEARHVASSVLFFAPENSHAGPSDEDRAITWTICCDEGAYHLVNDNRSRSIVIMDDELFELVEKAVPASSD